MDALLAAAPADHELRISTEARSRRNAVLVRSPGADHVVDDAFLGRHPSYARTIHGSHDAGSAPVVAELQWSAHRLASSSRSKNPWSSGLTPSTEANSFSRPLQR